MECMEIASNAENSEWECTRGARGINASERRDSLKDVDG